MRTIAGGWRHRVVGTLLQRVGDDDRERGDVPGWVLVTLMTAGLLTVSLRDSQVRHPTSAA